MNKITEFFLYASGADSNILEQYPADKTKYVGIGGTIFFTGLFAAMAASYALFTVFDSYWIAGALGLIWGLMIFNLDRFIVSSMRKKESFGREFLTALPRIVLATIISLVIATPFELKIFAKEIEPELVLMEQEVYANQDSQAKKRFEPDIEKIKQSIKLFQDEIDVKAKQRDELLLIAQQEADGTGGTKRKNLGPIYRIKKADADKSQVELNDLATLNGQRIVALETQLKEAESTMTATLGAIQRTAINGPAARMEALHRLTTKNEAMWLAHIFILLLLLMIECTPILVKLLASRSPYDSVLQTAEHSHRCKEIASMALATDNAKRITSDCGLVEKNFVSRKLDRELI